MGSTVTATANITPAPLVLSSVGTTTKAYDGTKAATLNTGAGTLSGVLGSDVVTFNAAGLVATYSNSQVGAGKPLTVVASPSVLTGASASNYALTGLASYTGNITPMMPDPIQFLTITGVEQYAAFVTFKMPILEFVPLFLSAPNVEVKGENAKAGEAAQKESPLVKRSIVERSIWSVDVSKLSGIKADSTPAVSLQDTSDGLGLKSVQALKVSYKFDKISRLNSF